MKNNIFEFFQSLKGEYRVEEISMHLSVHTGTIKRWIALKSVPSYYYFDLCRMDNIELDYTKYSEKQKDQFYTSKESAQYCIGTF